MRGAKRIVVLVLLLCWCGVDAQTNTLESFSTYRQCNVRNFDPTEDGMFRCDGPTGFSVFVVNMKPGTGAGDIYEVFMDAEQFDRAPVDNTLNPGADPAEDRARGVRTRIVVEMGEVALRYVLRVLDNIPSGYETKRHAGAAACRGDTTRFLCNGGGYTYYSRSSNESPSKCFRGVPEGLPDARCDPTSDETCTLATPDEMQSDCSLVTCGACTTYGGGINRLGCNADTFWWRKPLWRVYEIQPLAVIEYKVTVRIIPQGVADEDAEVVTLGIAEGGLDNEIQTLDCTNCTNTDAPGAGGGRSFRLVGFSQNGAVRAELLGQSRFGIIPYQRGLIVAADDPDNPPSAAGGFGRGYDEGRLNPRRSLDACVGAGYDRDPHTGELRTLETDPFCAPPINWFWAINQRDQFRFGPGCNEFGMRPSALVQDFMGDFTCTDDHHTCVPGIDFWSSPAFASRPPLVFIEQNHAFHLESVARTPPRAQAPFYLPHPSCFGPGCNNVWLDRETLRVDPPRNIGVRVRLAVRVAGNFSRLIRVLGTGELRPVFGENSTQPANAACQLTLGRQGSLFVDMCNTGNITADYSAELQCTSQQYNEEVNVQSATIAPQSCFRAEFRIGLSGAQIDEVGRSCDIVMFDAEQNQLDSLVQGCIEQDISIMGAQGDDDVLEDCPGGFACSVPLWIKALIGILVLILLCSSIGSSSLSLLRNRGGGVGGFTGGGRR